MSNEDTQADIQKVMDQEAGLHRGLTTPQLTMIAIGGAIGTGLFLGSGWAIGYAGPGVIISYIIGAFIALLLMGCLSEMTVATPTAGSLGVFADTYVSKWAGFLVRWNYWFSLTIIVGGDLTAVAIYMHYWFPSSPGWLWVVMFSACLFFINTKPVHWFGKTEYWLSMVKVAAIVMFILLGAYVVFGTGGTPEMGLQNYVNNGGFAPHGLWGIWVAVFISIFSFLGTEMIAVASGEAKDPEKAVPKALRATVFRLLVFYILTLFLILAIVPWQNAGIDKSPFVKVMELLNIPFAAGIMNFVVLMAAASSINSTIFVSTRMMFSLSCAGYAPSIFSKLSKNKIPIYALIISSGGIGLGVFVNIFAPENAYLNIMAITMFGGLFNWMMVFVSHLFFRRKWEKSGGRKLPIRMIGYPYLPLLGLLLLFALLITTAFVAELQLTIIAGIIWLSVMSVSYLIWKKTKLQS